MRRRDRHRYPQSQGYGGLPEPQAIDPASGFKVNLSALTKQWDGEMIDKRFVDIRNPQDFVRGVKDNQNLPFARPETPDVFFAEALQYEDGTPIILEDGSTLYAEGRAQVTAADL